MARRVSDCENIGDGGDVYLCKSRGLEKGSFERGVMDVFIKEPCLGSRINRDVL